jgi:protein-S-isoprenylcysteine O-methyltransferase Ste14
MPDPTACLARLRVPIGFALGVVALALATPTWRTLAAGTLVAAVGEAIRLWAAGHLEKSREVTMSGPYRWTGHPLYLGSAVMGVGVAVASASPWVALVAAGYLGSTLWAAIRTEEAFLRDTFATQYEAYRAGGATGARRRFSLARALRNREYRAVVGLLVALALLAVKAAWHA